MRSPGDRDPYKAVGEATRGAVDAAFDANVPPSAMRVLLALVREMTSWSRHWDEVSRKTLAARAGITERQATRAIGSLVDAGAISWEPGNRFRWSRVSVSHHLSGTSECLTDEQVSGTSECPTGQEVSGTSSDGQRDILGQSAGHFRPVSGTSGCPTPEVSSEVPPSKRAEPNSVDLEVHRRIRLKEQELAARGETVGHGLKKRIRQDVEREMALDEALEDPISGGGSDPLALALEAARSYGSRWAAIGLSDAQFADCLKQQRDWQQHPDVLEAAWASFHAYAKEAG